MLNIAVKAARAAGAIINRASLDIEKLQVQVKGTNDFVTEVDQAAERAIIEIILQAYPGHGILAEESGRAMGAKDSEYVWMIDPLDGTTNFIHGFPVYSVSIALAHRGVVQQGCIYDPTRNDLFLASRGRGAFLNERRLRVSRRTRLAESLIGTGFPFRKGDNFKRYVRMFEEVMQQCSGLRRPGSAALDLCYVAAGWYDGFFETGLSPWDIAAGSLMITEAGGLVGNFTGEADYLHQRELVAGTPKVYGQLVGILSPFSRVIKDGAAPVAPVASVVPSPADATDAFIAGAEAEAEATATATNGDEPAPAAKARKALKVSAPRASKTRGA
jgi:myo-inositol-1(or 4)-monophosphatase